MEEVERLALHRAALQSARDSLSFALGELDDARHGATLHATAEERQALAAFSGALDALIAVGMLSLRLIPENQLETSGILDVSEIQGHLNDPLAVPRHTDEPNASIGNLSEPT